MRQAITLLSALLVAGSSSLAQDSTATGQTLRGCLTSSNKAYTLTDQSGVTYKLSSKTDLGRHVGHEIEVSGQRSSSESSPASTGTTNPATSGTTTANGNTSAYPAGSASKKPAASAGPNAAPTFSVSHVKMISDHCAAAPGNSPQ
jgi:hypothetical protein